MPGAFAEEEWTPLRRAIVPFGLNCVTGVAACLLREIPRTRRAVEASGGPLARAVPLPSLHLTLPHAHAHRLCATLGSLDPDVRQVASPFVPIDPDEAADAQLFSRPGQVQLLPLRELPASVVSDVLGDGLSPLEAESRWKAGLGGPR